MVKAVTVVWLFCGLRVDEIQRLRVGCTRENWNTRLQSAQPMAVCNLDVPVNKTSQAFTKPVDEIVGESIRAWETQRPEQPAAIDDKTGPLDESHFTAAKDTIADTTNPSVTMLQFSGGASGSVRWKPVGAPDWQEIPPNLMSYDPRMIERYQKE